MRCTHVAVFLTKDVGTGDVGYDIPQLWERVRVKVKIGYCVLKSGDL